MNTPMRPSDHSSIIKKFTEPHWIDELQEYGLYSWEISQSIGITHYYLLRLIEGQASSKMIGIDINEWKALGWNLHQIQRKLSGNVGRPHKGYAFNIDAARAFVAQQDRPVCREYLAFLLKLERAMPGLVKALIDERAAHARTKIALEDAINAKPKAFPRPRSNQLDVIVGFVIQPSLFGGEERTPILKKSEKQKLTEREIIRATLEHMARILNGLANRQTELHDKLAFIETPSWNNKLN